MNPDYPDEINMNPDLVTSRLDGIPIVGHINALIYKIRGQTDLAVTAFSAATHTTGVICFGVLGGYLASKGGSFRSIVGGVIGGLLVDIPISLITSTRYEYVDYSGKLLRWNMTKTDWYRLRSSVSKDVFTGILASIACNDYNIPMMIWNTLKKMREIDYNSVMAETERDMCFVFENENKTGIHFNTSRIVGDLQHIWVHVVPLACHVTELLCHNQSNMDTNESFKYVTHRTAVMYFGVLGAHCADCVEGSIAGGIIGGVLVDAIISTLTSSGYGYFSHPHWSINDLIYLRMLVSRDGTNGLYAYTLFKKTAEVFFNIENEFELCRIRLVEKTGKDIPGVMCVLKIKNGIFGEIYMYARKTEKGKRNENIWYSDACQKPDRDTDYRDLKNSAQLLIVAMDVRVALTYLLIEDLPDRIPVENILQLESGDHIVYERELMGFNVFDHHAIVDEVFPLENCYTVYEQARFRSPHQLMSRGKAWIQQNRKHFGDESMYIRDHGEAGLSNYIVWSNAHYICDIDITEMSFKKKYNVVFNNCEHFANFCATNVHQSQQVQQKTVNGIPFGVSGIIIATGNVSPVFVFISRMVKSFDLNTLTDINFP